MPAAKRSKVVRGDRLPCFIIAQPSFTDSKTILQLLVAC